MNMDNLETNDLVQETGLEGTLATAVENTAELPEQETVTETQVAEKLESAPQGPDPEVKDAPIPTTRQEVIDQLEQLIESPGNDKKERIDFLKQTFYRIQKAEAETKVISESDETVEGTQEEVIDSLETRFKDLLNNWKEKRAGHIAEQEKQRQDNLTRKLQVIESIKALTESTEDIGRTLPEFRRLQQAWKEIGNVPQESVNELWKNYQIQVERFYDLLKINNEFRDYDFKKNLEIKLKLCESAERLAEEPDVVIAFRQLQKLHEEWRETGPVAKEFREDCWNRFKNASAIINKKHQQFFERLKSAETENLALKTTICEKVEAIDISQLTTYKAWDEKTAEIIQYQEQWKTIGFAPKKVNNKIFERFRAACDAFFQQKSEFYKAAKDKLNQNLEKKKQLCEKAEALKDSTDWKATAEALIQIQKEWKTIGPVPKKVSDAIWKRFIKACDYFFEQKEKNAPSQKNEEAKNLEAKKELISQLKNLSKDLPKEELLPIVQELIGKWNTIGYVPFKEKDTIYKQWHEGLSAYDDLFQATKASYRLNKFQSNLEDMSTKGTGKVLHERERLLRQFDSLSNEIKTAENNIGFFSTSKSSGNALLTEMNKKIEKLKEDRDIIYKKIKMIDEQL